nr:hypothetical protein [Tanacetum cinerariifolium]
MSSASSAVTYTSVYTNSELRRVFWGADEEISDGEPIYPEYIPLGDEHILPAEEQPLPHVVSPTTESPEYVAELDLEEDPEEYENDETEDGPVDHPMDAGDDRDEDDGNSTRYEADYENGDEEDEEPLALADFAIVIPTDELISISLPPEAEVERLLAMPTPSPLPLTLLSPPLAGEHLARCTTPATLPSHPLPPSLYPPPPVDHRDDIPESEQPPRKRIANTVEAEMRNREKVNTKVTELDELHEHDTQDLYALLDDARNETLRVMRDIRREMGDMQAELLALRGQPRRAGQPGRDAMIDQALLRNSTIGDGSHSSHEDNPRHVQTTCSCFYVDFMKCHPLNFKGNEGVDLRSRGLCNDLGSTQEEDDGQKLRTYAKRADNKRKTDDTSRNNHGYQQQPFKKQNVVKVYNIRMGERKAYEGSLPKSFGKANVANAQRDDMETPKGNGCFECGASGHFKRDCPKLRNKNGGIGMLKDGCMQLGMQRRTGMHQ